MRFRPIVALAALSLTVSPVDGVSASTGEEEQAAAVEAALADPVSFVLITSPGESFAAAASRQLTASPVQAEAIVTVLDEMDALNTPILLGSTSVSPDEIDIAKEAIGRELAQAGSGQDYAEAVDPSDLTLEVVQASTERTSARVDGPRIQMLSSPSFVGRQQIQAHTCTGGTCVLQSTRYHDARIDLGYTTAVVNGKTSGGSPWIVTATASCRRGSSSCGTKALPFQSTFGPGAASNRY